MELDLNDIRTFVIVAQAGTFSAAAKELRLPTSTVSRAITRLEQAVGIMLYQRSSKGLGLTDPGREYLKSCKRTLQSIREGRDLLEKQRGNPTGVIRITCPVTLARDVLAPVLIHFVEAYPQLRVVIEPYSAGWDQEPRDEVDVYFKMKAPRDSSRKVRCFPGTARALYASTVYLKQHGTPTDPMQLLQHRCIGSGRWKLTKGKMTITPDILFQVAGSDPGVHLELACKDVGIAVLPLWMAEEPAAQKSLVRVLPAWKAEPVTVCALYSGPTRVTPKVRVFMDFMSKYFGTDLDPRLNGRKPKDLFTDPNLPATTGP